MSRVLGALLTFGVRGYILRAFTKLQTIRMLTCIVFFKGRTCLRRAQRLPGKKRSSLPGHGQAAAKTGVAASQLTFLGNRADSSKMR